MEILTYEGLTRIISKINDRMVVKEGNTLTAPLVAQTNTDYDTPQVRNIILTNSVPETIENGTIVGVYE